MSNDKLTKATTVTLQQIRSDAQAFPRLASVPSKTAVEQLSQIVGTAFMYTGRNADEENIVFIASHLYEELMLDENGLGMKYISIAEISYVVKKAVLGQSGELYGISVATLYKVIADYCRGEGHAADKEAGVSPALASSPVNVMIDSYAGAMVRHQKN